MDRPLRAPGDGGGQRVGGPPWRVAEVAAAVAVLCGEPEPSVARLLACGEPGRRLELLRRDMERAADRLPPTVEGVRRTRLIAWDATTTLWEGWHAESGARTLLRVVRPGAPARALERVTRPLRHPALAPPDSLRSVGLDGGLVPATVLLGPILGTLGDVLPIEEPDDPVWRARVLIGALRSLVALHAVGEVHGMVCAELLVLAEHGPAPARQEWHLVWPGPPEVAHPLDPVDDLRALGAIGVALGDPVVAGFAEYPPPSASDAARLYVDSLGEDLLGACRAVWRRVRQHSREGRAERLKRLIARLEAAVPAPVAEGCVRAARDGGLWMVRSDGASVWGGACSSSSVRHLPTLVEGGRFDVAGIRALLRAGATRGGGDERRRATITTELGTSEERVDQLLRWLSGRMRLRTDRLVLDR